MSPKRSKFSLFRIPNQCLKMTSILSSCPMYSNNNLKDNKMAIPVQLQEAVYSDGTAPNKLHYDLDEVDNPQVEKSVLDEGDKNDKLFESMKLEINRLNSYSGKWPLRYIKPADLAENGLFYLQSDDKVQCAFCHVVIDDWNAGRKPLKEHMKKSPKCPFLMTSDVGNVPIMQQKSTGTVPNRPMYPVPSYKPKHPSMADLKSRFLTYRDWPRIMLSPKQLADCGLYYTGVADVVTCFFCGGSLGNWEIDDNPWVEHEKFFPNCAYLRCLKSRGKIPVTTAQTTVAPQPENSAPVNHNSALQHEVIRQACEIFPKSLVEKAVVQRLSVRGQKITSLHDLCEDILELKEKEKALKLHSMEMKVQGSPDVASLESSSKNTSLNEGANRKDIKDALLCKICMDREMGIVFQPCGHLVSCPNCAMLIFNCPLCRRPVTNKVRTYLS